MLSPLREEIKVVCQVVASRSISKKILTLGENRNFPYRHAMFYSTLIEDCRTDIKFIHIENHLDLINLNKTVEKLNKELRNNEAYIYLDADLNMSKVILSEFLKENHIHWIVGTRTLLSQDLNKMLLLDIRNLMLILPEICDQVENCTEKLFQTALTTDFYFSKETCKLLEKKNESYESVVLHKENDIAKILYVVIPKVINYEPFWLKEDGKISGLFVDVAKEVADGLGIEEIKYLEDDRVEEVKGFSKVLQFIWSKELSDLHYVISSPIDVTIQFTEPNSSLMEKPIFWFITASCSLIYYIFKHVFDVISPNLLIIKPSDNALATHELSEDSGGLWGGVFHIFTTRILTEPTTITGKVLAFVSSMFLSCLHTAVVSYNLLKYIGDDNYDFVSECDITEKGLWETLRLAIVEKNCSIRLNELSAYCTLDKISEKLIIVRPLISRQMERNYLSINTTYQTIRKFLANGEEELEIIRESYESRMNDFRHLLFSQTNSQVKYHKIMLYSLATLAIAYAIYGFFSFIIYSVKDARQFRDVDPISRLKKGLKNRLSIVRETIMLSCKYQLEKITRFGC
ncbi:DgyrCDS5774 [Dimorphilus gyrociliatus]|uniref:DgyrCDS5774 n=1 Tax=Dimorphilus gyrociliatus TaxID=2664684 RepID=A0A7I8VQQ9_9ANNE|nr:DgyrCDS5774 [Dimorphilus gyrociliatus]